MTIDASEVRELEKVMAAAAGVAAKDAKAIVARGALNIKRDAQKAVTGLAHAPAYPRSISYETRDVQTGPYALIGPDKEKRQGALGNILEFGTVKNPPHPHMAPAAERELPKFVKALEDAAAKAVEGR